MDRKEFLAQLGLGSTAVFAGVCMQSCSKSETSSTPPSAVDFTLDLNSAANTPLKTPGGFIIFQGVIVAQSTSGSFLAVSAACPHEQVNVEYQGAKNQFFCPRHASYFTSSGSFISGPANGRGLTQYKTSLNGNSLRVYA
jgi:cytochrome b6-f complex iron-sulfur subunit